MIFQWLLWCTVKSFKFTLIELLYKCSNLQSFNFAQALKIVGSHSTRFSMCALPLKGSLHHLFSMSSPPGICIGSLQNQHLRPYAKEKRQIVDLFENWKISFNCEEKTVIWVFLQKSIIFFYLPGWIANAKRTEIAATARGPLRFI